jgi:MFS family permease
VIADAIDSRYAMWLQCSVFALFTWLLLALPSPVYGTAIVVGFGVAAAARDVIYPLIIDYCFGARYLAEIYGAIMFLLFMGAVGTVFAGALFDALGNYRAVFATYGALATLALLGTLFLRDERTAARAQAE